MRREPPEPGEARSGDAPPLGGTWGGWYALVLLVLAAVIGVLAWLTGHYR